MKDTAEEFHEKKQSLESALLDFIAAAGVDERDLQDELSDCLADALEERFLHLEMQ